jgi:hypothetical protein
LFGKTSHRDPRCGERFTTPQKEAMCQVSPTMPSANVDHLVEKTKPGRNAHKKTVFHDRVRENELPQKSKISGLTKSRDNDKTLMAPRSKNPRSHQRDHGVFSSPFQRCSDR